MVNVSTIEVAAVCFVNERGQVLTVRKVGATAFQLPGGKPDPGEGPRAAAAREVAEEIGVEIDPAALVELGQWTADAANEPNTRVRGTVYLGQLTAPPEASSEIEELRWHGIDDVERADLAPLLATCVLPAIRQTLSPRTQDHGERPSPG